MTTQRAASGASGFTLIEIVLVIMVMGVLSVTFLSRTADPSVFTSRTLRDDFRASLRYAQMLAMQRGCRVRMTLGADGYRFWEDSRCSQGPLAESRFTDPVLQPLSDNVLGVVGQTAFPLLPRALILMSDGRILDEASGSAFPHERIAVGTQAVDVYGESGYVD